jgi:hypothetical protein
MERPDLNKRGRSDTVARAAMAHARMTTFRCPWCSGPIVDMDGIPRNVGSGTLLPPCFNCFIGRPFGRGLCKICKAEKPLVRRYLSGVFCDEHAPDPKARRVQ